MCMRRYLEITHITINDGNIYLRLLNFQVASIYMLYYATFFVECPMASANMNGKVVIFFFVCVGIHSCNSKSIVPPNQTNGNSGTLSETPKGTTTRRAFTCQCEGMPNPVCANNGVTYENPCRFECAKHKVERLRVVKEGDCGKYISKLQFWSFG